MQRSLGERPSTDSSVADNGGARWYGMAVMALAAVLFLARLGARALWSSEGRWAEIVREMQLNANYFWPTINGKLYYDKPLLSYWFIVAASKLTGGLNETAARLPSAIFGLAGVALIIVLARRLYDRKTAAIAGFILATSFSYVFFSRDASADIETTTGVLAALMLFIWYGKRPDGWWLVWLWLIMAVTSLTKGLIGFVLPLAVMGTYSLLEEGAHSLYTHLVHDSWSAKVDWTRRRLRWFFNLKTPIALLAAGVVYCAPFTISQLRTDSDAGFYMVFHENVLRFFDPFDHRGPVYLYVYVIFALMAPWSIFLPAALLEVHRKLRKAVSPALADADFFALTYFWATFVFFTLSRSRRSYYLLPILPAAALIVGRLLSTRAEALWAPARRLMKIGYGVLAAGAVVLGIAFLLPSWTRIGALRLMPESPGRLIFAILWLVCLGGIAYAWRTLSTRRIALSTGAIAYFGLLFLFVVAMPLAERYRFEKPFAHTVRHHLGTHTDRLALFRIWGPGLVYYLSMPHPITSLYFPGQLADFAESKGTALVITRAEDLPNMKIHGEVVAGEPALPWQSRSRNQARYLLVRIQSPRGGRAARSGSPPGMTRRDTAN